jgi:hypothetical protein
MVGSVRGDAASFFATGEPTSPFPARIVEPEARQPAVRILSRHLIALGIGLVCLGAEHASAQDAVERTVVLLEADPPGSQVSVSVEGATRTYPTPVQLELAPGVYELEFTAEGHEPLPTEFAVENDRPARVHALLLTSPPERPQPEDLGLTYLPVQPLRLETEAADIRGRYYTAAEVFMIMPLAQAALTWSISQETRNLEYWVGAGIVLTVSSVLLGRRSYDSRLEEVRLANEEIKRANEAASVHNRDVETQIEAAYAVEFEQWQFESAGRGVVTESSLEQQTSGARLQIGPLRPRRSEELPKPVRG